MKRNATRARGALVAMLLAFSPASLMAADSPADVLRRANEACDRGALRECIEIHESFVDAGGQHPDVSFNRGLAYLARVRKGDAKPGDLGRAAAAFEETLMLRPDDLPAQQALDLIRGQVAKRAARNGGDVEVSVGPPPARALAELVSETTWAVIALVGALVLTVSLIVRRSAHGATQLAGNIGSAIGLALTVIMGGMTWLASHERHAAGAGVVIAPEARLLDDKGAPLGVPALPEAARVDVLDRKGATLRVRWGQREGNVPLQQVRVLRAPG
ncbi:MAG: hypothetical protein U0165_18120 [Polyangiaceae bacterium]